MACPFFMPLTRLDRGVWRHAPRLPLGDAFRGVCRAGPDSFEPPESSQEELCNCGYARGRCARFPSPSPDAVRFSIVAEDESRICLVYIFEKDHAPESHGVIEYSKPESKIADALEELLAAQAGAFLESHLASYKTAE